MKNTIGQNIAYYRKKLGMTQEQLSAKMDVTPQAVSKWENDLSYPDLECVSRLARNLKTTVDSLINGEKTLPNENESKNKKRILTLNVDAKTQKVTFRIPVELILKASETGNLEKLTGANFPYIEMCLELIKSGTNGEILDIQSKQANVKIEVIEYEN